MSSGIAIAEYEISIDCYKKIFNILYEEHNNYCNTWIAKSKKEFNLKKTCICDAYNTEEGIQKDFEEYIDSYLDGLQSLYFDILERIYGECHISIRGRTKSEDSILYKIDKKSKENDGKFPINKCLNDLLGFRIIDDNYDNNMVHIEAHLNYLKKDNYKIKHIDRVNHDYVGYHIYFNGEKNKFFPMELQIWSSENEQNNLGSHSMYKQDYIEWTNEYKNL